MDNTPESKWKSIICSCISTKADLQFFVSPEIPKKTFNNCIKSYAKYVTSLGDKIIALYDGGRAGKEGFALTDGGISYNDAYGNFGGSVYENILSYNVDQAGDPAHPFPIVTIHIIDGTSIKISFLETPQASGILVSILDTILEENKKCIELGAPLQDITDIESKWEETIMNFLLHSPLDGLYKRPYIPENLLINAIAGYARDISKEPENVLVFFEYKAHGHEGFILTSRKLIYNMGYENWGTLSFDTIIETEYVIHKVLNTDVPTLNIRSTDGRVIELQFIIHPKVARFLFDIMEKIVFLNKTEPKPKETQKIKYISDMIKKFLPHDPANRIYKSPGIPESILASIKTSYSKIYAHNAQNIHAVYDNSPRNTGESGCVLTDKAIYFNDGKKDINILQYENLESFEKDIGRHHNNVKFTSSDGQVFSLSFYLYRKAHDEFLYFLRQSFPEKEKSTTQFSYNEPSAHQHKKIVYSSRRNISSFLPREMTPLPVFLSFILFFNCKPSLFFLLLSVFWFFSLMFFGLTLISLRRNYFKISRLVRKIPYTNIKNITIKDNNELVKVSGCAEAGPFTLDDNLLYRETLAEEEAANIFEKILSRFNKQLTWQSVPFYVNDETGEILIYIQDSLVGLYNKNVKTIESGEMIHICGSVIKNPYRKEFPKADYAITKCHYSKEIPLIVSDNKNKIGTTEYDVSISFFELAAGIVFIMLSLVGEYLLFFWMNFGNQKGINIILDLFNQ